MPGGERTSAAVAEFVILDSTPADGGTWPDTNTPKDNADHHEDSYTVGRISGGFTAEVNITAIAIEARNNTYSRVRIRTLGRLPVAMERLVTPPLLDEEQRQHAAIVMAGEALHFANLDLAT